MGTRWQAPVAPPPPSVETHNSSMGSVNQVALLGETYYVQQIFSERRNIYSEEEEEDGQTLCPYSYETKTKRRVGPTRRLGSDHSCTGTNAMGKSDLHHSQAIWQDKNLHRLSLAE